MVADAQADERSVAAPGAVVWRDPTTREEKCTPPGDRWYSTALMYAEAYIDEDGRRVPIGV